MCFMTVSMSKGILKSIANSDDPDLTSSTHMVAPEQELHCLSKRALSHAIRQGG